MSASGVDIFMYRLSCRVEYHLRYMELCLFFKSQLPSGLGADRGCSRCYSLKLLLCFSTLLRTMYWGFDHHNSSALSGNVCIGPASTTHPPSHRAGASHGLFANPHNRVPILNVMRMPSLGTARMCRSSEDGCVVHRICPAPLGLQAWMSC